VLRVKRGERREERGELREREAMTQSFPLSYPVGQTQAFDGNEIKKDNELTTRTA